MASDAAILAALAGIGDESTYYSRDPYFQAGQQIRQIETPKPRNSTEAFLLPFVKGIGGGAVTGYGKQSALETALGDIGPAYKTLTGKEYEKRPDWSIQQGKVDLLSALMENEQERALQLKKQEQFGDLQRSLVGQGIDVNPETGEYSSNPQILAALEATEEAKARAKAKYRPTEKPKRVDIPADTMNKLMTSKAFIDEGYQIADALDTAGPSWGAFNAMKAATGFDKEGLGLRMSNLADTLSRARSGAALNAAEVKLYNGMIKGDITGSPAQVASLLRKLVDAESRMGQSRVGLAKSYEQGGIEEVFQAFTPRTPPPNPSQFKTKAEFSAAYDKWKGTAK